MNSAVIVFPGSNCDHDALYTASEVFKQEAEYIWHKETSLKGADAVILFNQGNAPTREELFVGTLGRPFAIPVIGASFADGVALAAPGTTATVVANTISAVREDVNITTGRLRNSVAPRISRSTSSPSTFGSFRSSSTTAGLPFWRPANSPRQFR